MKKLKEKRKYVARQGIKPRTPDLQVRCPTDCATRPGLCMYRTVFFSKDIQLKKKQSHIKKGLWGVDHTFEKSYVPISFVKIHIQNNVANCVGFIPVVKYKANAEFLQ